MVVGGSVTLSATTKKKIDLISSVDEFKLILGSTLLFLSSGICYWLNALVTPEYSFYLRLGGTRTCNELHARTTLLICGRDLSWMYREI